LYLDLLNTIIYSFECTVFRVIHYTYIHATKANIFPVVKLEMAA
jgi:hypothetical protein